MPPGVNECPLTSGATNPIINAEKMHAPQNEYENLKMR